MTTARTLRATLGGLGVLTAGYGVYGLLNEHVITDRAAVGEWLVAGVIGHDFLLAPAVFILCAIVYRLTNARWRGRLAAFLLIGGSLVAVSIPALIRQGLNRNTTVLPLDYARNLTVLLAILAAIMVVYSIADRTRRHRATRKAAAAAAANEAERKTASPAPRKEDDS
ncbi:MAG TPA: hypothetical protein VL551_08045 [Actinospica sp.]|jgi:hypothetical protein|nr:hypothetical protein [Actinospica sp.]